MPEQADVSMWAEWWSLVSTNANAIMAVAAIAAALISLVGFGFTIRQLFNTQSALKSGNTYNIQKDARDLLQKIISEPGVIEYIKNYNPTARTPVVAAEIIEKGNKFVGMFIQFYMAVYRQAKHGGIIKAQQKSMADDFNMFVKSDVVADYVIRQKQRGVFTDEFDEMVEYWRKAAGG